LILDGYKNETIIGMKKLFILCFIFFGMAVNAQEFETHFFRIDAESLPEVSDFTLGIFTPLKNSKVTLKEIRLTLDEDEFWVPVDMVAAVNRTNHLKSKARAEAYIPKSLQNFKASKRSYTTDGASKVTNIVYKDARSTNPFYYCSRSSPNRFSNRY